jgi:hypothetical protein
MPHPDSAPHLPLPEGLSVPMGRSSRTVLSGFVVGTAAHAASTRLRLSPPRPFHSVVARCVVYDASKPRGLSAWFPLLEPGMSLDQARQQLARDAGGGVKPGAPSSPKLQPKPTWLHLGRRDLQTFRCLILVEPRAGQIGIKSKGDGVRVCWR